MARELMGRGLGRGGAWVGQGRGCIRVVQGEGLGRDCNRAEKVPEQHPREPRAVLRCGGGGRRQSDDGEGLGQ